MFNIDSSQLLSHLRYIKIYHNVCLIILQKSILKAIVKIKNVAHYLNPPL